MKRFSLLPFSRDRFVILYFGRRFSRVVYSSKKEAEERADVLNFHVGNGDDFYVSPYKMSQQELSRELVLFRVREELDGLVQSFFNFFARFRKES